MEKLDFGKKLIETREAKGLTQAEVAEMCKIATRTIQRIETGVVKPRAFTIKLISETLGFDFFETSNTGKDVKSENQDSNSENHNLLWYLKDLFNLKTNVMSKLFVLTVILSLGSFGIISLTNTGAQNVQQSTNSVEKINNSTSKGVSQDKNSGLLQNLNSTYKEIDFIVISENENNAKIQDEIRIYVENVKNKFMPRIPLISDTEALKMDISKYSFMVYGTIKNNKFLQNFSDYLPIQISDSEILADKKYITDNGKVIYNLTNPLNKNKYLIIYTAQNPEGLIGINNVFHGPTNYIVFENREKVLTSGFFVMQNNKWVCKSSNSEIKNTTTENQNSTSRTKLEKKLLVEKINWNSLESYSSSQIEFISNEMTMKCTECKYVELKTQSGITGLFILGNGIVEVKKGNITASITGCMIRLNPKDFETMITIKDKNKTNDKEFVVISKNTLKESFTHCYHSNMDALIPPVGAYALNFFSKSLGEILASYSDNNTVIYNFTEREFISK